MPTSVTIFITALVSAIVFLVIGIKAGGRGEGHRWSKAAFVGKYVKFRNRLFEVKRVDMKDFVDD